MPGTQKGKAPPRSKKNYNRIKEVLREKGISAKEFSLMLGVSERTASKWLSNDTQPSIKILFRIAITLKVEAKDLLVDD